MAEAALKFAPVPDARDGQWPSNPLIAAVVWQLPKDGPFSAEQRTAWLKMAAMAFDVVYGPVDAAMIVPIGTDARPGAVNWQGAARAVADAPVPGREAHAGHKFYIGADGTACNAAGEPVLKSDVPADEMIFDYRAVGAGEFRDTAGIRWADGETGVGGLEPGVGFCGPG